MKHGFIAIMLTGAMLSALACADQVKKYINQGDIYSTEAQWTEAISEYSKAIESNPNLALAYSKRGQAYAAKEDWTAALSDLNKALELDPELIEAYYNRGLVQNSQGRWDMGISDLSKVIEFDPTDPLP